MRIEKKLLVIPAALVLAGASGVGFVHAANGGNTAPAITAPAQADNNTGNVQGGDQSAPDVAGATEKTGAAEANAPEANAPEAAAAADAPGGPDVQQGDQTGPDTGN